MDLFILLVVLGSAVLHASWNAVIKGGTDTLIETTIKSVGAGIAVMLVLPFIPLPLPESRPFLAATTCLQFLYNLCIAYAYRDSDLSYAYTTMRGSAPLLTALISVFVLHDPLSATEWAAVVMLSSGVLILAADAIRRGRFSLSTTALAMGSAVIIMGYSLVDGHGVRLAGEAVSYIAWLFFLSMFPISLFTLAVRRGAFFAYVKKRWQYGAMGGLCCLTAYGLTLWAMTRAPIATVAALRETSVVFGMVLAVIFLNEKMTFARTAAVLLVLFGAIVMRQG